MKKFLVLGASGYLGSRVFLELENCFGTFFHKDMSLGSKMIYLDSFETNNLESILNSIRPDVVINCIGFTDVDRCEILPEKCFLLNSWLPYKFALICKQLSIKYIHFSTDHYLNTTGKKLCESDSFNIVNQYSLAKSIAEKMVYKVNNQSIIIRANFFHFNFKAPRSFLDNLILQAEEKTTSESFNDVYFTPISTSYLIQYMKILIDLDYSGLIHVASNEVINKYLFHETILKQLSLDINYHKQISVDKKQLAARRPKFMALDNGLLAKIIGTEPPNLYDMISEEIKKSGSLKES